MYFAKAIIKMMQCSKKVFYFALRKFYYIIMLFLAVLVTLVFIAISAIDLSASMANEK